MKDLKSEPMGEPKCALVRWTEDATVVTEVDNGFTGN